MTTSIPRRAWAWLPGLLIAMLIALVSGCQRADESMASDARARLASSATLRDAPITVIVKKGVVLLRGRAGSATQQRDAAALVAGVPGVHTVINQVTLTDEALAFAVDQALHRDPQLSGVAISVAANSGVVHLSSSATNAEQRERAVAIARAVAGVVHVEDDMR